MVKGIVGEWGACSRTISLDELPSSLAYKEGAFAVGLESGEITIPDIITGSQVAVLSEHTDDVRSLTFSLDGVFLVSGCDDRTVKLWDVQTGGVVKTFCGHTNHVLSVSISPECATIASGSRDKTICLWHVQAGDCFCVINGFSGWVNFVHFSPTNPQVLISASDDNIVQQWDINGHQIGPAHEGRGVTYSLDGTRFISWGGQIATVQDSDSRGVVTKLQTPSGNFKCCCFSFNGKWVAGGAGCAIYIWDITGSDPHLIETLVGHSNAISFLIFPSFLISASYDQTVKFWQISASSTDLTVTDTISIAPTLSSIKSVSLQVRDGVAISSDSAGVVKIWDILTGLCKASFQTPVLSGDWRDAQLIEGRLIVVWKGDQKLCVWDGEKGESLQTVDTHLSDAKGIRISGDGTKVFFLADKSIQAWSMWTGETVGKVELEDVPSFNPLYVDGSKIWVYFKDKSTQGWDFGISGPSPVQLSKPFPDRPHLKFMHNPRWDTGPAVITDGVTGEEVFQLVGRYADPYEVQWDGQYLVAGYRSGEVLILDFNHMFPQ